MCAKETKPYKKLPELFSKGEQIISNDNPGLDKHSHDNDPCKPTGYDDKTSLNYEFGKIKLLQREIDQEVENLGETTDALNSPPNSPSDVNSMSDVLSDFAKTSTPIEANQYPLNNEQKKQLDSIITLFPDFDKHGLGRTKLIEHKIDVGDGGVTIDPEKISAIVSWPVPKNLKQVRGFLGLAGWYRRFIENFSTEVCPITDVLSTKKKFTWTPEAQAAFERVKHLLTTAPVLTNPDFSKKFFLHCDASDYGIGAVLVQLDAQDEEKPIAFMSKKLNAAQRNYSVTERECLAALEAIKKFRCYLEMQDKKTQNQSKYPDVKVEDKYVYIRTEHYIGDEEQENLTWKLWIPYRLREDTIKRAHDSPTAAHGGMIKTLDLLRRNCYWPGLIKDVRNYVRNCDTCKATKAPNFVLKPPMGNPAISVRPFQRLYVDLLGPYPRSSQQQVNFE
ncbi:uncharacterized protein LOC124419599 [Lucilia cuprina]|uniref:uncharacterized protein LOC124419599 n=1 Tax=Lucilia cuprina TaxID=7375 RepID=UPI001F05692D|nr:uncharacterized protein LOC124419599 [Lucilia cuprina]